MGRKASIAALYTIAALLIIYALFTVIAGFVREGASTILDALVCVLTCGVICAIIYIACRNASIPDAPNPRKAAKRSTEKSGKLAPATIVLFCLIAAAACVFFGLGIASAVKISGDGYIKTTAKLVKDGNSLFYDYRANGEKFYTDAHISFFGIYLPENSTAEIFVSAADPHTVENISNPLLFFVFGTFFAAADALFLLLALNKTTHLPLAVAIAFLSVGGGLSAVFAVIFGFGFLSLITSGAVVYCLNVFNIFGLYFLAGYVINGIRGILSKKH